MQPTHVPCNLCGSWRHRARFHKRGHLTGHLFRIVECESCGLIFVNPRLSDSEVRTLYDAAYFRGEGFDPFACYEGERGAPAGRDSLARHALERIAAVKSPPADFLEIGPGLGQLLRLAKERGYRTAGVELSAHAATVLQGSGLQILHGTLEEVKIADASFDVVVAMEVIEHLPDPKRFFTEVARILRPGGLFYYETGNIECEAARCLGADWEYIRPEGHLYYFSPRTLTRYLKETGFQVCYPLWFNPTRRGIWILEQIGLVQRARPVFTGWKGRAAHLLLKLWDWPPPRRPYPMAIRSR